MLSECWPGRRLAIITDETVARLYPTWVPDPVHRLDQALRFEFPAGEQFKTRQTWATLSDRMLEAGLGRDSAVVALGGGVVGDLAGFVAATYLRGIPYAQVPTTLLAMLDASVGGKVGVDTPHGKNLIGAFYPPALVLADPATLSSLPEREYRGGLAEAVKHGVVADEQYFAWIEDHREALRSRDSETLAHLIRRSVEIKAGVVGADEREAGRRAVLNAGHTVGHGLEQASGYRLPHGEAVALGLIAECLLAERMGLARPGLSDRVHNLVAGLGLPTHSEYAAAPERVAAAMAHDKKNRGGALRLALPVRLGAMHEGGGTWTVTVDPALVLEVLRALA
jgi:3-dehydroquinate synthase